MEEIKCPNPNNSGMGRSFCRISQCKYTNECIFAFNSVIGGREMRLDFNLCNLSCILCWSNNNAPSICIRPEVLSEIFIHCVTRKDNYIANKYPEGVADESSFKTRGLQIVGGEPLLTRQRYLFLLEVLNYIDLFIQKDARSNDYLLLNSSGKFKIKIFTNGVCIGNNTITDSDLTRMKMKNVILEPVLGFYHSADFNIKTPDIMANNMFIFRCDDSISLHLKTLLEDHINHGGQLYVEPVHAVPQSIKGKHDFLKQHGDYLEETDLLEPELKGGSRRKSKDTALLKM